MVTKLHKVIALCMRKMIMKSTDRHPIMVVEASPVAPSLCMVAYVTAATP